MGSMEPPSFEVLPSKPLCANVLLTLRLHWSYAPTIAITHACQLNNFVYQEFDARVAYVISKVSKRIKVKVLFMHCSLCS